ncbi:MAG: hypothetical protein ACK4P1_08740, partial [Aggregatilineales bacterium]
TGVELTITNTALGALYIRNFQLRGEAIVAYDPVQAIREDKASIAAYGERVLSVQLPLPVRYVVAESLAGYLLARHKEPVYRLARLQFENQTTLDPNISIMDIEIGDVLLVKDRQLGIDGQKYMVTGISYSVSATRELQTEFSLRPLEDVTYWVLGDTTYGSLGVTTRLAV